MTRSLRSSENPNLRSLDEKQRSQTKLAIQAQQKTGSSKWKRRLGYAASFLAGLLVAGIVIGVAALASVTIGPAIIAAAIVVGIIVACAGAACSHAKFQPEKETKNEPSGQPLNSDIATDQKGPRPLQLETTSEVEELEFDEPSVEPPNVNKWVRQLETISEVDESEFDEPFVEPPNVKESKVEKSSVEPPQVNKWVRQLLVDPEDLSPVRELLIQYSRANDKGQGLAWEYEQLVSVKDKIPDWTKAGQLIRLVDECRRFTDLGSKVSGFDLDRVLDSLTLNGVDNRRETHNLKLELLATGLARSLADENLLPDRDPNLFLTSIRDYAPVPETSGLSEGNLERWQHINRAINAAKSINTYKSRIRDMLTRSMGVTHQDLSRLDDLTSGGSFLDRVPIVKAKDNLETLCTSAHQLQGERKNLKKLIELSEMLEKDIEEFKGYDGQETKAYQESILWTKNLLQSFVDQQANLSLELRETQGKPVEESIKELRIELRKKRVQLAKLEQSLDQFHDQRNEIEKTINSLQSEIERNPEYLARKDEPEPYRERVDLADRILDEMSMAARWIGY